MVDGLRTEVLKDIPEDKLNKVVGDFEMDNPVSIEKVRQSDGRYTIIAKFKDD